MSTTTLIIIIVLLVLIVWRGRGRRLLLEKATVGVASYIILTQKQSLIKNERR
jgi:hypothetical protein